MEPGNSAAKAHTPAPLLVWPRKQRCAECGAEWCMAGIFPLTDWQMSDGHVVKECEGRGEGPRPRALSVSIKGE